MRSRFLQTASALLDEREDVVLVLAEISASGFREAARRHPRRVVNVGIREQAMVGVAAGLALEGFRPIVHTYAPFLVERAFEQIKLDLAHQDVGAVLVSIGASHDASHEGRTHQTAGDVALIDTLPGFAIHVPGHPDEAERLLRQAVEQDGRAYLRLSEQANAAPRPIGSGRVEVVRSGRHATVIAVGPMLDRTLAAVEALDVTVLYASTVRPFDTDGLLRTLADPDVVLVEPYLEGTSARLVSAALTRVPHRLLAIGVPGVELRKYGTPEEHDRALGLTAEAIERRVRGFLAVAASENARDWRQLLSRW
jgi:transketolase